jgi:ATP-binding cassette subfamily B (MDR/TAP) protein 1
MSVLFGNLVEDFVTFTTVLLRAQQGDEAAKQQLPTAAANFRRVAALDATYFVYLGP